MMPVIDFDPDLADDDGLVFVGGDLEPDTLLHAYACGVFPTRFFPLTEDDPMHWWSPDPRAIIPVGGLHVSRRLARTVRSGKFSVSYDRDFDGVIRGCAQNRAEGTWITPDMIAAYARLHAMGHAHSVEVWYDQKLVGGTYGVTIGGLFAAESKFHRITDASKVALVALMDRLVERRYTLLDIQLLSPHTERMGAHDISRGDYLRLLQSALLEKAHFQ